MSETSVAHRLKLVFSVRHGKDSGDHLSDLGKEQINRLAEKLRRLIPTSYKVVIISSDAFRAKKSAEIIGVKFDVTHQVCKTLYGDDWDDGYDQMEAILTMTNEADAVIAVTHYKAPSGIAHAFASRFGKAVECRVSDNGNGFMVSLETGEVYKDIYTIPSDSD